MSNYAINFQGTAETAAALDAAGMQKVGTSGFPDSAQRYTFLVDAGSEEDARAKVQAALGDLQIGDLTVKDASPDQD